MNSIIWQGVSSTTIQGLLICELPPITKPEMRKKETVIDGRDGSIIEELGYASYVKNVTIGLHGNFDINKVIKYFTGEGDIVFSNEPDKVYKAKICGKIDYTRLLRYRQASIPFLVQPFKYKLNEYLRETPTTTTSGTSIVANNTIEDKLKSFKIYGKSTQDGIPTIDAPVDIMSIGDDGGITVSINEQSFAVQTPNGLCGIPVSSGGNYTDANGQQWICDEIDIARGVYVQRVKQMVFNGTEKTWVPSATTDFGIYRYKLEMVDKAHGSDVYNRVISSSLPKTENPSFAKIDKYCIALHPTDESVNVFVPFANVDDWKSYLAKNPMMVIFEMSQPIYEKLADEVVATYVALHTYNVGATISNDDNAYMMVEYFKPFEVFNEGLENSKPLMVLKGSGTVEISVNGTAIFSYTFPEGENEVYIDSETEDAYLGSVLKNRNMSGEFPILIPKTNKIEWSGDVESISILPRSRWL